MKPSYIVLAVLFACRFSTVAQGRHAEAGLPFIKHYVPKDYGAHPQNWTIAQDERGVMYIGNTQGVLEYDGVSWRIIPAANGSMIRSLALDSTGLVYAGAQGEFGYLWPDSIGNLRYVSLVSRMAGNLRNFGDVWTTLSTPHGVYFSTYSHLFRWDGQRITSWGSKTRFRQASWIHQKLYIQDEQVGLLYMNRDSLQLVPGGEMFADKKIYTLVALDSNLLIGTREQGLFVHNGRTAEPMVSDADQFLLHNQLYCGIRLDENTVALGTRKGGVILLDGAGRIRSVIDKNTGLGDNNAWGLFQDRRGLLWVALNDGISRVDLRTPLSVLDERTGLSNNTIEAVVRHEGRLYVSQGQDVLRLVPNNLNDGPRLSFQKVKGIQDICWNFVSMNDVLVASSVKGVHEIRGDQARLINRHPVMVLYRSSSDSNRIYLGLLNGLASMYRKNGGWIDEGRIGGIDDEVLRMAESRHGNLWLCTRYKGILRVTFAKADDRVVEKIERYDESDGIPLTYTPIVSSAAGREVFATDKGVMRFDDGLDRFVYDSTFASFLADGSRWVYIIREDPYGNVWIESGDSKNVETGISELQPDGTYRWNGLPFRSMSDFEVYAFHFDSDSVVWIGGSGGRLLRFDRRIRMDYDMDAAAVLRKISIRNDSVIFAGYSANRFSTPDIGYKTLPYRFNALRFEFGAPSFHNEWDHRFQYFLEGFDEEWCEWTRETKAVYTNIPEGEYTFRVRAQNIYGKVSGEDLYDLKILPPWFRTWWAYGLYFLLAVGAVRAIVQFRSMKLEKEKRRLEGIVKERVNEIEEKNKQLADQAEKLREMDHIKSRFFANISHEFRTPLTLIMAPIDDLLAQARPGDATEGLRTAMRNAKRLLRLINELLDLAKLESGRMELRTSKQSLMPFLRAIVHSFASLAEARRIHLQLVEAADAVDVFLDREKAEKIFFNLIANAFKFTPDQGYITVTVKDIPGGDEEFPEGAVEVGVHDTGIGIPAEQLPFLFNRFSQGHPSDVRRYEGTGIGLALVKELVDLHRARIRVKSEPGVGTEFDVVFPLGSGHLRSEEIVERTPERATDSLNLDIEAAGLRDGVVHEVPAFEGSPAVSQDETVVLVVEDNPDVRSYVCGHLKDHYRVLEAQNGSRGLELAAEQLPDLVISDVMMPGMDGYELTRKLKSDSMTNHIPVILLTAKASEDARLEGLETGADDYVTKPFNSHELQARVRNLVANRHALREKYRKEFLLGSVAVDLRSVDEEFLTRVRTVAESNLSDPDFTVERLREQFAMSQRQFHRKLHALTGQAPVHYLRAMRLRRARQLLQKKTGTVSEIAFDVGFSNLSYFAKSYREQFGVLPSEDEG